MPTNPLNPSKSGFSAFPVTKIEQLESKDARVWLPTGESFEVASSEGTDWENVFQSLTSSGRLYLFSGQFFHLIGTMDYGLFSKEFEDFVKWVDSEKIRSRNRKNPSWDHATALRIELVLSITIDFDLSNQLLDSISSLLGNDLNWATDPQNIALNNHGVFVLKSLLFTLSKLEDNSEIFDPARTVELKKLCKKAVSDRLPEILQFVFGNDGWCGENSPMYDRVWINLLNDIASKYQDELAETGIQEQISRILEAADRNSRHLLLPRGHYVPRGDSARIQTNLTTAKGTAYSERVGIWAHGAEDFYVLATSGYASTTHKHPDDTQVYMSFQGVDFIIDGGFHSYDYSDPRIRALRTPAAHSVLTTRTVQRLGPWELFSPSAPVSRPWMSDANNDGVTLNNKIGSAILTRILHIEDGTIEIQDSWQGCSDEEVIIRWVLPNNCTWELEPSQKAIRLHRIGVTVDVSFSAKITVEAVSGEEEPPYRGWYSTRANELIKGTCLEIKPKEKGASGGIQYRFSSTSQTTNELKNEVHQTKAIALKFDHDGDNRRGDHSKVPRASVVLDSQQALIQASLLRAINKLSCIYVREIAQTEERLWDIPVRRLVSASSDEHFLALNKSGLTKVRKEESEPTKDASSDSRLTSKLLDNFHAVLIYRASRLLHESGFTNASKFLDNELYQRYNCRIPGSAKIGSNFRLGYGGIGVVIHSDAVLGDNVTVAQNVTLGGRNRRLGPPVVGDNVYFGANSLFLGGRIGNDCVVGAGSVVLEPVENNSIVAGNPAKFIRKRNLQ